MPGVKAERDAEIVRSFLEDQKTRTQLSERFGITGQRVSQILRERGVTREEIEAICRIRVVARWECEVCGHAEWLYGAPRRKTCSPACHSRYQKRRQQLDPDDLSDELLGLALELGRTPTMGDMNDQGAYSHMAYVDCWGSWSSACEAAGLRPNGVGRPGHGGTPLPPELQALTNGNAA